MPGEESFWLGNKICKLGAEIYLKFENLIIPSPESISSHLRGLIFKIFSYHGGIMTKISTLLALFLNSGPEEGRSWYWMY